MNEDYPVRLVDLPPAVRGFCYHDDDGQEYIVLNSRLTREQNQKTYLHEREHIRSGDLTNAAFDEYGGFP